MTQRGDRRGKTIDHSNKVKITKLRQKKIGKKTTLKYKNLSNFCILGNVIVPINMF